MCYQGKSIFMIHTFRKVSKLNENKELLGRVEDHFGVKWRVILLQKDDHLAVYLKCCGVETSDTWSIDAQFSLNTLALNDEHVLSMTSRTVKFTEEKDTWGLEKFRKWENMEDLVVDDRLTILIKVEIKKMVGVYKPNLRNFDASMKNHSDVILEVQGVKFYVAKLFITLHSPFFQKLVLDGPPKTSVTFNDVDSDDFQNYLEVLYGDSAIDDITVEGVLLVAKKYKTSIVTQKCENFLLTKSKKHNVKKQQLASVYELKKIKVR